MKFVNQLEEKINKDLSFQILCKIVLILCIIWLFLQTGTFWNWVVSTIWSVLKPFVIGFTIAYLLKGVIAYGEKIHIRKGAMIAICYIAILIFFGWLMSSLIPMLLSRTGDFINSMIHGVNWLMDVYIDISNHSDQSWMNALVRITSDSLESISDIIPEISNSLPALLTNAIGTTTTGIFAFIISIFMSIEWEKIRFTILRIAKSISELCFSCLIEINEEISSYIHSLFILMLIKFAEYTCVYLLIGHSDWLILALLTSISLLIPYIGPTIINCIGILSAISLPNGKVILLILLIVILSQVDEYVIAPLVHSRNTSVTPLWVLFSIFAASALFGMLGLVIAIPSFLAIRIIYKKLNISKEVEEHASI